MEDLGQAFHFEADGEDVAVLLHGWTGSPAHLRLLGAALAEAGVEVFGPLLAGHNETPDALERVTWKDWIRSAGTATQSAVNTGKRLHLAGLSMGGLLALLLSPTFEAASVTTINAPQRIHDRFAPLARLAKPIYPMHKWEREAPPDPGIAEYWVQYSAVPLHAVTQLLHLIRATGKNLDKVTCPALIIQSRTDETVRPVSAEHLYEGLGSREKRILWLDQSVHVATLDVERDRIHRAVIERIWTTR